MSGLRFALAGAASAAFAVLLAAPQPAAAQGRPDCTVVLRKMHDLESGAGSNGLDAAKVARKVGADVEWVERCAEAYGRHLKPQAKKENGADDQLGEVREAEEFDELAREEKETAGDHYFTVIENDDQDRRKLARHRDEDTNNEWDPIETHEWGPDVGHAWRPFLHDDDLPEVQ